VTSFQALQAPFLITDDALVDAVGQHPFDAYFVFGDTSALQPLCDALE